MFKVFSRSIILRSASTVSLIGAFLLSGGVSAQAVDVTMGSTTVSITTDNLTCEDGGKCLIGDTGPGGGVVFYILDSTVKSRWRYLEAAPDSWNNGKADPGSRWCSDNNVFVKALNTGTTPTTTSTSSLIGSGAKNTKGMLGTCATGAANLAAAYTGGGKADWYLPSQAELNQMFKNRAAIGVFVSGAYWSSTEVAANYGRSEGFDNGLQLFTTKTTCAHVRPIRAF